MKQLLPAFLALTASPALAHEMSAAHVHGPLGAIWPLGALAALAVAVLFCLRLSRKHRS